MILPLIGLILAAFAVPAVSKGGSDIAPVLDANDHVAFVSTSRLPIAPDRQVTPTKLDDSYGPVVQADAAMVVDVASGVPLYQKEPDLVLPVASLTKLMTSLVFLDHNPGFDTAVTMEAGDDAVGGKLFVRTGEVVSAVDLLYTGLVGSANNAMNALARSTGLTRDEFVSAMNAKAAKLGLVQTRFTDVTGLDQGNVSTVREYLVLAHTAFANDAIRRATVLPAHEFLTLDAQAFHRIRNTDELLGETDFAITAGKTGFTDEAGNCLVLETVDPSGTHALLVIVLGNDTSEQRFSDARVLAQWAYDSHQWSS